MSPALHRVSALSTREIGHGQRGLELNIFGQFRTCLTIRQPRERLAAAGEKLGLEAPWTAIAFFPPKYWRSGGWFGHDGSDIEPAHGGLSVSPALKKCPKTCVTR
jgi:hypothetical protein